MEKERKVITVITVPVIGIRQVDKLHDCENSNNLGRSTDDPWFLCIHNQHT